MGGMVEMEIVLSPVVVIYVNRSAVSVRGSLAVQWIRTDFRYGDPFFGEVFRLDCPAQ